MMGNVCAGISQPTNHVEKGADRDGVAVIVAQHILGVEVRLMPFGHHWLASFWYRASASACTSK